jgi:hypothetical protein
VADAAAAAVVVVVAAVVAVAVDVAAVGKAASAMACKATLAALERDSERVVADRRVARRDLAEEGWQVNARTAGATLAEATRTVAQAPAELGVVVEPCC